MVCTLSRASPLVKTRSTTRIGLSPPRFPWAPSGMGRFFSMSGKSFLYRASFADAPGSLTVT